MKVGLKKNLVNIYFAIFHSIAFVPTAFSVLFITLAILLISIQKLGVADVLISNLPWLKMRSAPHAVQILTTLLSGMISLTVFSFSVVMIILNQAARNFIPKILYKLTEDKFMQIVLGCYIGTIVYYIILLVNIGKAEGEYYVPDLAFILGVFFAIGNMFLFVYFIHRTTTSIHAKKLSKILFHDTKEKLHKEKLKYFEDEVTRRVSEETQWYNFSSNSNGYLQSVEDGLVNFLSKRDLVIKIEPVLGEYVVEKMALFSLNKRVEEKVVREIEGGLIFYDEDRIGENSKYGFVQITEIAIKALSTGLNDPGTAIFCVEYLTELFSIRIKQSGDMYKRDKKGAIRILSKNDSFEQLLFSTFNPIRNYGKNDLMVLGAIVKGLWKISLHDKEEKYVNLLNENLQAIIETAQQNLSIESDQKHFNKLVHSVCKGQNYFIKTLVKNKIS